jgi:hypothetical protein
MCFASHSPTAASTVRASRLMSRLHSSLLPRRRGGGGVCVCVCILCCLWVCLPTVIHRRRTQRRPGLPTFLGFPPLFPFGMVRVLTVCVRRCPVTQQTIHTHTRAHTGDRTLLETLLDFAEPFFSSLGTPKMDLIYLIFENAVFLVLNLLTSNHRVLGTTAP